MTVRFRQDSSGGGIHEKTSTKAVTPLNPRMWFGITIWRYVVGEPEGVAEYPWSQQVRTEVAGADCAGNDC